MACSGSVIRSIKLTTLELLGGIFGGVWIAAVLACLYFLYGSLAHHAPWSFVVWSMGVGVIARQVAAALNRNRKRIHYVDQLVNRGCSRGDAIAAWRTATNGGLNLLRNLQQAETSERRISTIGTPSAEANIL